MRGFLIISMMLLSACANTTSGAQHPPLHGALWLITQAAGEKVQAVNDANVPNLVFDEKSQRVSGSTGCNRIAGGYALEGDKLRFQQMVSTRMACISGMEQEDRILKALGTIERYRFAGGQLELLDAAGAASLRLRAETSASKN
ncbi:MAG: META domain-containing protein [Zoogloeaceae bacterium]|nr:META domain-containing protein [Zoogloeaceae bacterium]